MLTALNVVERNLSRISAKRILRRIESGRRPAALLPSIPLFHGGNEAGIITKWVEVAQRQTDTSVIRAMPLTEYFAEAAGCIEVWREAMKGWDVIKSQVFEEWTALAQQKGFEEGDKEGVKKGQRLVLLRILQRIQANLPADLEQAIGIIDDPARLDAVVDTALSSASLEDFRRATGL